MNYNLHVGMKSEIEQVVEQKHTAIAFGSGTVKVLATPMMIALMEKAALSTVDEHLGEGFATVGTLVNTFHMAATPVGMKVKAVAELIRIEGKRLTFKIDAFDDKEKIGEGLHERYIIEVDKFVSGIEEKAVR